MERIKSVLTIAGSDCTGGAGIQADIRTCSSFGVYSASVITAVTSQNNRGVKAVEYVGDRMLESQLDAVFEMFTPDAVKIGMIPGAKAAEIIADFLKPHANIPIMLDPVLAATTGESLSGERCTEGEMRWIFKSKLFPLCTLVTPNIPEFIEISGIDDKPYPEDEDVLRFMESFGIRNLLLKGGHEESDECRDALFSLILREKDYLKGTEGKEYSKKIFTSQRIESRNTHGTGCVLSSAIASGLAKGECLEEAVRKAKEFITAAIAESKERNIVAVGGSVLI